MTILITGVGGFVGPHVVRALRARGDAVWGAGLEPAPPAVLAGDAAVERWVQWDVAVGHEPGQELLAPGLGVGAVIHLAGQASAARSFDDPVGTFAANAGGTQHLLEAARHARFKGPVLVVSSSEVYGHVPPGVPIDELAPLAPVSPYSASKAAAEALALAYANGYGLRVVIARPFSHTGPGQSPAFAIASWARQIAGFEAAHARGEQGPFRLAVGNLDPVRDYSDVRDVAQAYLALIDRGEPGTAYNVASGRGVRLADVVAMLAGMARVPVDVIADPARRRPADLTYLVGNAARLAALGVSPKVRLEVTLSDLLEDARHAAGVPVPGGS
jgi:GDP-4-dehydro-6-deoxy-D-mannose reductase